MTIAEQLYAFMTADAGIAALVGNGDSPLTARISVVNLPQAPVYPAIAYQQISSPRSHTMDGKSSFVTARWQISAFAQTYNAAISLADAIEACFNGHTGPLVTGSPVQGTRILDRHDEFAEAARVYMIPVDIEVQYNP